MYAVTCFHLKNTYLLLETLLLNTFYTCVALYTYNLTLYTYNLQYYVNIFTLDSCNT